MQRFCSGYHLSREKVSSGSRPVGVLTKTAAKEKHHSSRTDTEAPEARNTKVIFQSIFHSSNELDCISATVGRDPCFGTSLHAVKVRDSAY